MRCDSVWRQLEEKRTSIVEKWSELVTATYSPETRAFLRNQSDQFANPVGFTISQETKAIYDELIHGMDLGKLAGPLAEIIRIRSVQDFSPSQAIGFVFLLKQAIREGLAGEMQGAGSTSEEMLDLDSRVDKLALLAFDIYMQCREKICEIRVNEVAAQREMALRVLARTDPTSEIG